MRMDGRNSGGEGTVYQGSLDRHLSSESEEWETMISSLGVKSRRVGV